MSIIDTLITDRTQADVDRWAALQAKGYAAMTDAEKTEWNAGMNGAYNVSDLNRVGQACAYLAQEAADLLTDVAAYLEANGVAMGDIFQPYTSADIQVEAKTDWTIADIPAPEQMETYRENIVNLRGLLEMPQDTPAVPATMARLTFSGANDIETILIAVDTVRAAWWALTQLRIDYIGDYANQLVSGTFYAGNNRTLQHYSRGR